MYCLGLVHLYTDKPTRNELTPCSPICPTSMPRQYNTDMPQKLGWRSATDPRTDAKLYMM